MTKIIKHVADLSYRGEDRLFTFGIPLPKGKVTTTNELQFYQNNALLSTDLTPVSFWNDSTIRWLRCQTIIKQDGIIGLALNNKGDTTEAKPIVKNDSFEYPKNVLFKALANSLQVSIKLTLCGHKTTLDFIKQKSQSTVTTLSEISTITGVFKFNKRQLKLCCQIEVSNKTDDVFIKLRLHNPHAAAHSGGQWDLGDNNSVRIKNLSLIFQLPNSKTSVQINDASITAHKPIAYNEDYTLEQYSSGGDNWQSPIHWDEHKKTTVHKHGFQLFNEKNIIHQGLRAEPIGMLSSKANHFKVKLEDFWQNFPISLTGNKDSLSWKLLEENTELQGGESKTWRFNSTLEKLNEGNQPHKKNSTFLVPQIKYNPEYLTECAILPHLAFSASNSALTTLINKGIVSSLNDEMDFFQKREKNDVYGWRHYGELDADHEAVNAPKDSYFISHYNNQYDPLMGMTLQFLHHGEPKWLQLLKPLNQHIQDIDIYDTTEDKAEYNGGLMWHTDHYLSAETCTHRSNSIHHTSAYDGFLGGGGPGGQHCYTTGLALQYWLFGDEEAKKKVSQLCTWIRHFYNGSGSIAERTFRLATMDFKQNELTNIGIKASGYKYPLDRGTGNYLVALIDNYSLTEDPSLITEMGVVITHTIHPEEDIFLRNLHNPEESWFYTIFLQAVVRFLFLKEQLNEIDHDYWYARHTFMHYCQWMKDNESFYLDKPELLEFPNDTWCAQEIRKANLFYYASYFSANDALEYIQNAEKFYDYITQHLSKSKESSHTRVLAILMQNDGVRQKFVDKPCSPITHQSKHYIAAPSYDVKKIMLSYFKDTAKLLMNFSPSSEWQWIKHRLSKIFNR
jgi:hypothetical protein